MRANRGLLAIVLATSTWGTVGVAVDVLYRLTLADALGVGFWRLALSAPVLLVMARAMVGPGFWRLQRQDLVPLGIMGVAVAAYQVFYFAAIPLIGVAAAVLVNLCSAPIVVAVLSGVFLGEPLTARVAVALAGAVTGAALLVGGTPEASGPGALLTGGLLAFGAGLSYSLVVLTGRVVARRYHPVQPVAMAFTLSALLLLPLALPRGLVWQLSAPAWGILAYLAVVPTAVGYGLYLYGLRTNTATVGAIASLLEPLGSTLLAVAVLGERLSPGGALGAALLLSAVALLYLQPSPQMEKLTE